jgi:hypothetical protein
VTRTRIITSDVATQKFRGLLLQTARNDFPAFYAAGSAREIKLMDMLVLLTALFMRLNEAASGEKSSARSLDEERVAIRQMFDDIRAFIRNGRTFGRLPDLEREKIQRVIFNRVS